MSSYCSLIFQLPHPIIFKLVQTIMDLASSMFPIGCHLFPCIEGQLAGN